MVPTTDIVLPIGTLIRLGLYVCPFPFCVPGILLVLTILALASSQLHNVPILNMSGQARIGRYLKKASNIQERPRDRGRKKKLRKWR